MNFSQSFRLALKSLMVSKMRAILTMLGIIIGVAAVIIITSMGNGMQNLLNEQFDQLGANLIQVQIYGRGGGSRTIDPDDMYELVETSLPLLLFFCLDRARFFGEPAAEERLAAFSKEDTDSFRQLVSAMNLTTPPRRFWCPVDNLLL